MNMGLFAWKQRLRNAIVLVLVGFLSVFLIGSVFEKDSQVGVAVCAENNSLGSIDAAHSSSKMSFEGDATSVPFQLFSLFNGFSSYEQGVLPEGFVSEVVNPNDYGCLQPTWSGGIVGMVCPGNMLELLSRMSNDLQERGWTLVSEGDSGSSKSFVKDSGEYRWLFISGNKVAGEVSIWMAFSTEEQPDTEKEQ